MVWVVLDVISPTPCNEQGHLPPLQVAQRPVQLDLDFFQGWDSHHFSGQHVPVSHHLTHEKFLLFIWLELILFQFKTISPFPITMGPDKKFSTFFLKEIFKY